MNKPIKRIKVESPRAAKQDLMDGHIDMSLQETKEVLFESWIKQNLDVEIAVSEGSRVIHDLEERRIMMYSISSFNRRKFMMYIIRATLEGTWHTVSELTQLLGITRNSVETMVKECSKNGWISVRRCSRKHKHLRACDNLLNCYRNYAKWLYQQVHLTGLKDTSTTLGQVNTLMYHASVLDK